jgi:hypothetical protein
MSRPGPVVPGEKAMRMSATTNRTRPRPHPLAKREARLAYAFSPRRLASVVARGDPTTAMCDLLDQLQTHRSRRPQNPLRRGARTRCAAAAMTFASNTVCGNSSQDAATPMVVLQDDATR